MSTALQVRPAETMSEWQVIREQSAVLITTGFLPQSIKTPEQAMAIILTGRELGIGTMAALNSINVIQGKPTVSPQLMMALINRTGQLEDLKLEASSEGAICTIKRKGRAPYTTRFGPREAMAMNLHGKDNYKKQPATMYKWRALADAARTIFPDAVLGLYTPDEMGATVDGETGEVIDLAPEPKTVRNVALQVEPAAAKAEIARAVEVDSQDDPLPEFEQRQSEESPEEIEAERAQLTAQIKECFLVCKSVGEFVAWWQEVRGDDRPRPWLRSMATTLCERAAAFRAANAEPKAEEVFDSQKHAAKPSHAAQAADGSVKLLRKDASGNLVPQWEKPTPPAVEDDPAQVLADTAAQGYATPSHKRLDELITYWNSEGGQSFDVINQKIAAVTGGKYALDELDEAEAAKACGALSSWNPTADAAIGKKGAKKK